ncbi:MAG: hypothetical protein KGO94_09795 [Alphaproteobacteria bacterium]|nr:hypothetical protein [Alphaproteobacteria bacterium]
MIPFKRIILGYLASVVVAASLLTLVFFQIVSAYSVPRHGLFEIAQVWVVLGFWTIVISLLPATILIYFAEGKGWRDVFVYAAVGAGLGALVRLWFDNQIMLECAIIGAVAGCVYWFVAGRFAGLRTSASA